MLALASIVCPAGSRAATVEVVPGASGMAGQVVSVSVRLGSAGAMVVGTQNDLGFDAQHTPVAARPDGMPDCTVNAAIGKNASFAFEPVGCGTGVVCTAVRAVIISLVDIDPIPDQSVLYGCQVAIAAGTAPGSYPLRVTGVVLVDPDANELPGSTGVNGALEVVSATPTPTPTRPAATLSATPTATSPAATVSATPSASATASGSIPIATATATATPTTSEGTPTATPALSPTGGGACAGDCNHSGEVTIAELITLINVALGNQAVAACPAGDLDGNGTVAINEIVAAVGIALSSCP